MSLALVRWLSRATLLLTLLALPAACSPPAPVEPATKLPPPEAVTEVPTGEAPTTEAVTAPAAGQMSGKPIVVGSKNFTEEYILAELYAQTLEKAGFTVERKLNLGATDIAQAALVKGDIDLYPEYTSTGLLTVLKEKPLKDKAAIFQAVKDGYATQFNLTWLDPAPLNNPQALATTKAMSDKYGLKTYSDMVKNAGQLTLGGPPEFNVREDGLPALKAAYGDFEFKTIKQLDPGLRYPALVNGDIDVTVAFGTDGQINGFNLVLLEDDKGAYPSYQPAPVVRNDTLAANPGIAAALNGLEPLLTTEVMQSLNWKVDGPDKQEPAAVAKAFLASSSQ